MLRQEVVIQEDRVVGTLAQELPGFLNIVGDRHEVALRNAPKTTHAFGCRRPVERPE